LLTGVCFAALLMLLLNPLRLFGTGFQLSFLAVASLAFSLPFAARITGFRNRLTGRRVSVRELESVYGVRPAEIRRARVLEYLIPLFAIQAFMLPVTALRFHVVSVSALALNIPIIALASLVVPFGLVLFALSCLAGAAPFLEPLLRIPLGVGAESGGFLIELMLRLVRTADALPGSSLQVASPPAPCVLAFYALGFFLLSETFAQLLARWRDRPSAAPGDLQGGQRCGAQDNGTVPLPQRMRADSANAGKAVLRRVVLIVLVCLVTAASPACQRDHSAFVFVDVGQGDCLHVRTPDGRNYLMDGGGRADYDVGKEILLPYLLQNGVTRLDGVFVSHLHMDHFKGLIELSEHMDIGAFYVYEGAEFSEGELWRRLVGGTGSEENAENTGDSNGTNAGMSTGGGRNAGVAGGNGESTRAAPGETPPIVCMAAGDRVLLGGDAAAEVLYPPAHTPAEYQAAAKNEEDENKSSLLVRFENREMSVLMTGDVGEPGELDAMRFADLGADILKVGHHGSKTSTSDALLAAVDPAIAVIQVGRNNYGHPTPEILAKLSERDIIVYRNDLDGAVCVNPARDGFSVKTVKRDCVSPMLWKAFERMRFEQF
jgi:competence protein ComEC